ncbi:hypothetical protein HPB49_012911 [Dermacentor silvarum]|uniref:Uncharacterized protein n=1 Tax=Dermacentor silvarum TaxID=543639 RepID=A0ACB8E0A9_DERSI|nr:hypothetical protein HPB49_012911 [Dermacentor silvarum]
MPRYEARRSSSLLSPPDDNGLFASLRNHIASAANDVEDQFRSELDAGARVSCEVVSATTPSKSRAGSLADAAASPRRLSGRRESSVGSGNLSGRDTPLQAADDPSGGEGALGFGSVVAHMSSAFRNYLADMTADAPAELSHDVDREDRPTTPPVRQESLGRFSVAPAVAELPGRVEEPVDAPKPAKSEIRDDPLGVGRAARRCNFPRRSQDAVLDPNVLASPRDEHGYARPENVDSLPVPLSDFPATERKQSRRTSSLVQLKRFAKFRISLRNGDSAQCDERPIIQDGGMSSYERNLYLYHEEMPDRPRVATLLSSLANYEVAIPSVAGEEAQAAPKIKHYTTATFCGNGSQTRPVIRTARADVWLVVRSHWQLVLRMTELEWRTGISVGRTLAWI